jgi:hypothetical protein
MNSESKKMPECPASVVGESRWMRDMLFWLPACVILGLLTAWAAVDAQFYFAPLLLFPILVGVLLGALLVLVMRMAQVGHRPTIVEGALLAAGLAAIGMHYLTYRINSQTNSEESAQREIVRRLLPESKTRGIPTLPDNFFEYMMHKADQGRPIFASFSLHGGYAWLLWIIEALLLMTAVLLVVIPGMNFCFCRRCHSWYRTIRSARLPPGVLLQLAGVLNLELSDRLRSGRCRLLACLGGCGPTGCELAWEELEGKTSVARVWIRSEQRNDVLRILDQYATEDTATEPPSPDTL